MSKYTIELRSLKMLYGEDTVKSWFKDYNIEDYLTAEEIAVISERGTWSKDRLANKIYNHYFMREIGFETPALFRLYVKNRMNEVMEEYLPLIYSASIEYDPLVNVDYSETFEQTDNSTTSGSSSSTSNSSGSGLTINSDTPQGEISKANILAGNYASSTAGTENNNEVTDETESEGESNAEREYTKHVQGNSGVSATAQKMIEQYRDNIRAIDREIIDHLNDLFMGIY